MFQLNHALAQKIVNRTMKIIGHNINVMNAQGVILGSGDKYRIDTVHEGALLAISQNRDVAINHDVASSLHGVKPGLNLPLHYHGEIIGVIGITGQPESIKQFGELLKMTAEMIVEQATLQQQLQWQNRQKEEFILQLIKADTTSLPSLKQWALQLDINLDKPRVVAIIEIAPNQQQHQHSETLKQIMYLLQNPDRDNLVAMTSLTQLVILKPAFLDGKQWNPELENQRIDKLMQRIPANMQLNFTIALGHYFTDELSIAHSYCTAQETLVIGKKIHPNKSKYLYENYSIPILMADFRHHWRGDSLVAPYLKLVKVDKNQQLQKTLAAYITHLGNQKSCAESLFIHRNTLRYRLDKITQITGIELHQFQGLLSLYLGQLIHSSG